MSRKRSGRQHVPLTIAELAVDPADVDAETYPVRIRLSRPMSAHEAQALAALVPTAAVEADSLVLPDAKLDDVAHAHDQWSRLVEEAVTVGEGLSGQASRSADDVQAQITEDHRNLTRESSVQNFMH